MFGPMWQYQSGFFCLFFGDVCKGGVKSMPKRHVRFDLKEIPFIEQVT